MDYIILVVGRRFLQLRVQGRQGRHSVADGFQVHAGLNYRVQLDRQTDGLYLSSRRPSPSQAPPSFSCQLVQVHKGLKYMGRYYVYFWVQLDRRTV